MLILADGRNLCNVKGKWAYLYFAFDKQGQILDFIIFERRDEAATTAFFAETIVRYGKPQARAVFLGGGASRLIACLMSCAKVISQMISCQRANLGVVGAGRMRRNSSSSKKVIEVIGKARLLRELW